MKIYIGLLVAGLLAIATLFSCTKAEAADVYYDVGERALYVDGPIDNKAMIDIQIMMNSPYKIDKVIYRNTYVNTPKIIPVIPVTPPRNYFPIPYWYYYYPIY